MWNVIGFASLITGSITVVTYCGARYLGHRLSPTHSGKWTLQDGDIPEDLAGWVRIPWTEPDRNLLKFWVDKGIPHRTGIRNLSNNRVLMALLFSRSKVPEVNEFIMTLRRSGRTGSTHKLHPRADYDFDLNSWATILHLFGDDPTVLYPETVEHITSVMMAPDRTRPSIFVPWTLGTFLETENHVLMTEGSYYLCSKWLEDRERLRGSDHPSVKDREAFLTRYLDSILHKGFYEFNSDPYSSYTLHALLNLDGFSSENIRNKARELLDRTFFFYRIGSLSDRRYPPFRRRMDRSSVTSLKEDGARPFMVTWEDGRKAEEVIGPAHALVGSLLPYRPPLWTEQNCQWAGKAFTAMLGHGPRSSPEIYSKGKGFLITAGGVHRGSISRIVNRPTTLLLDDGADDLSEVAHIGGLGADQRKFNNTGVVRNIAVGPGPVTVPDDWTGKVNGIWTIYDRPGTSIMVHSRRGFGILCVLQNSAPSNDLAIINEDRERLVREFRWNGARSATYDVHSPNDRWSVLSLDGIRTDRRIDLWPKLRIIDDPENEGPPLRFNR